MEWVEVEAKTVDAAVAAALQELGLSSKDEVSVEVIQEPEKGFLGFGGTEAIVRVMPAPKSESSRGRQGRRGRGQGGGNQGGGNQSGGGRGRGSQGGTPQGGGRDAGAKQGGQGRDSSRGRGRSETGGAGGDSKDRGESQGGGRGGGGGRGQNKDEGQGNRGNGGSRGGNGPRGGDGREDRQRSEPSVESTQDADIAEQAEILKSFMVGLIAAFGLEGDTSTRIEDDIIFIDVTGEQTEALVGNRGVILQSILDLMKIIVQRKTHHRARIRLDIAGYSERRREALGIYSRRLSEQVLTDGEEVMLEPMHPGDRKVVHDAVAEIEGVRSWSEGEEPQRSVIIGMAPGFTPSAGGGDDE